MKVRSITPILVPDEELRRRQERYDRLAPPGMEIHLENLSGTAVPRQLATVEDVDASNRLVLDMALATDPGSFDIVLPDCVLDPAVGRGVDEPVPIVGMLALGAAHLRGLGLRYSAVTRNTAIGDELADRIAAYGLDDAFAGVDVLDLDLDAIRDERRWQESLAPARQRAAERGTGAIINGCSAVNLPDEGGGAAVVDPTQLALRLLGATSGLGIVDGRRST